jgi:hypothetical protein
MIATAALMAAVVGIAYRIGRSYARWKKYMHPLTEPRARIGQMKTRYGERRADLSDLATITFGVLEGIARARAEQGSQRPES